MIGKNTHSPKLVCKNKKIPIFRKSVVPKSQTYIFICTESHFLSTLEITNIQYGKWCNYDTKIH